MNINISDEMIEKLVKEQVKARVNQYLAEQTNNNPHWIWNMCRDCVWREVQKVITNDFVLDTCKELSQHDIAEKIVDKFAEKIADLLVQDRF